MQFLKILFWCLLAFVAAVFTLGNWTSVPIKLWGGMEALVNLPLLLLLTFLAGLVPTLLWHSTLRWRMRNRLTAAERALHDLRVTVAPPPLAPTLRPDPVVVDARPVDPV
jgi:lipopolysaccharide assembly protein A